MIANGTDSGCLEADVIDLTDVEARFRRYFER
jgi:hypothetical protein